MLRAMLCSVCESFDLSPDDFIVGRRKRGDFYRTHHELGRFRAMRARTRTNPLCRTFVHATILLSSRTEAIAEDALRFLVWVDPGCPDPHSDPSLKLGGLNTRAMYAVVASRGIEAPTNDRIRLLADDAPQGASVLSLARQLRPEISLRRVKRWLRSCDQKHLCGRRENFRTGDHGGHNFRLIDTWSNSIVPATVDQRYMALSYVWGAEFGGLKLLKTNCDALLCDGSLRGSNVNLSRTIRDAMRLVSSLGYRYLWVDALCILQDDAIDKANNISRMGTVYERAACTIIAATGTDSDAGLPGFRQPRGLVKQYCVEIKPGMRLICTANLSSSLEKSYYDTRGWTCVFLLVTA
jgi:hypothetical protein